MTQTTTESPVVITMTVRDCFVTITLYPDDQVKMDSNVIHQDVRQSLLDLQEFSKYATDRLISTLAVDQPTLVH